MSKNITLPVEEYNEDLNKREDLTIKVVSSAFFQAIIKSDLQFLKGIKVNDEFVQYKFNKIVSVLEKRNELKDKKDGKK